jgi:hypothetical protein
MPQTYLLIYICTRTPDTVRPMIPNPGPVAQTSGTG